MLTVTPVSTLDHASGFEGGHQNDPFGGGHRAVGDGVALALGGMPRLGLSGRGAERFCLSPRRAEADSTLISRSMAMGAFLSVDQLEELPPRVAQAGGWPILMCSFEILRSFCGDPEPLVSRNLEYRRITQLPIWAPVVQRLEAPPAQWPVSSQRWIPIVNLLELL